MIFNSDIIVRFGDFYTSIVISHFNELLFEWMFNCSFITWATFLNTFVHDESTLDLQTDWRPINMQDHVWTAPVGAKI